MTYISTRATRSPINCTKSKWTFDLYRSYLSDFRKNSILCEYGSNLPLLSQIMYIFNYIYLKRIYYSLFKTCWSAYRYVCITNKIIFEKYRN